MLHHHTRQQSNSSLRELINQLVNTLKHPFDSTCQLNNKPPLQQEESAANAKLSHFEKTYVSFPEFVDAVAVTANENSNNRTKPLYNSKEQKSWHQQSLAY